MSTDDALRRGRARVRPAGRGVRSPHAFSNRWSTNER